VLFFRREENSHLKRGPGFLNTSILLVFLHISLDIVFADYVYESTVAKSIRSTAMTYLYTSCLRNCMTFGQTISILCCGT
jgi:hypothetical protein